jgi:hypothetical protein
MESQRRAFSRKNSMRSLAAAIATALMGGLLGAPAMAAPLEPLGPEQSLLPGAGAQSALPVVGMTPDGRSSFAFLAASSSLNGLIAEISHGPYWQPPLIAPLRFPVDTHQPTLTSPALSVSQYGYPLMAWERRNASYLSEGVFLSYFDALGRPLGERLRVDQQLPQQTHVIRTASNAYGTRHLVLWGASHGGSVDARARWFDNSLQPLGDEARVDIGGLDVYPHIDVAMLANYPVAAVIAYVGLPATTPAFHDTLYLRRMSDQGELSTPVSLVAGENLDGWIYHAELPTLAAAPDGSVLVVWRAVGRLPGTSQRRVQLRAQRLDANLAPIGVSVALTPLFDHLNGVSEPHLAASSSGGFALVWIERATAQAQQQLRLVHLDASASPTGAPQTVSQGTQQLFQPQVAIDADGDTVVAWTAIATDGSASAMRRRYRGNGAVDLELATSGSPVLAPGQSEPLTLVIHNRSPLAQGPLGSGRDYASGITVQLDADPAVEVSMAGGSGWTCTGSTPVACSLQAIVPTESSAPALELVVSAGTGAGSYPLQLSVTGDQDDPQASNNVANLAVHVLDPVPDAFAFASVNGVARGSLVQSAATTVTGFDGSLLATVTGGELSVNGGAFSSAAVAVDAGASLRLRHTAAATFSTIRTTTLEIGGISAEFRSETEAADTTPDAFAFASVSNVASSTTVDSGAVSVTGINAPAAISISNGGYSLDGGAFTSAAGQVTAGQQVRVRHTSASAFSTSTTSTLTIGGVSAGFTSTTEAADTTPESFAFASVGNVARNTPIDSASVSVTGINAPAAISISNGSYSLDGGAFTSAAGQVSAGQQVRVRHTSASAFSTSTTSTLTIGGVSAGFTSTTEAIDTTPAPFDFVDVVEAPRRSTVSSNIVTVSGINAPATVTVSGGGASFAINGGAFSTTARTVVAGDRVQLRLTAPNSSNTTVTATLSIGGVSDLWRVTTGRK